MLLSSGFWTRTDMENIVGGEVCWRLSHGCWLILIPGDGASPIINGSFGLDGLLGEERSIGKEGSLGSTSSLVSVRLKEKRKIINSLTNIRGHIYKYLWPSKRFTFQRNWSWTSWTSSRTSLWSSTECWERLTWELAVMSTSSSPPRSEMLRLLVEFDMLPDDWRRCRATRRAALPLMNISSVMLDNSSEDRLNRAWFRLSIVFLRPSVLENLRISKDRRMLLVVVAKAGGSEGGEGWRWWTGAFLKIKSCHRNKDYKMKKKIRIAIKTWFMLTGKLVRPSATSREWSDLW